jgi:hypothetical protein
LYNSLGYLEKLASRLNNYLTGRPDILLELLYYCFRSPSVWLFTSAWNAEAVALGEHRSNFSPVLVGLAHPGADKP